MMNIEEFGKRVKLSRNELGLTQNELALKVGVSSQAISKWERGQSLPDIAIMAELSKILSQSLDFLVLGRDRKGENRKEGVLDGPLDSFTQEIVVLEFGVGLIPAFTEMDGLDKIARLREEFLKKEGIYLYPIRVRDNEGLGKNVYKLYIKNDIVIEGEWNEDSDVCLDNFLIKELYNSLTKHKTKLQTLAGTKLLLTELKGSPYDIVKEVIPTYISLIDFHKYLVSIIESGKSISNIGYLLESLVLENSMDNVSKKYSQ